MHLSGPLPFACPFPGCGQRYHRSDEGGLRGHIDKEHRKLHLANLNPVLVYRNEDSDSISLFMVRHTLRGRGTCLQRLFGYLICRRIWARACFAASGKRVSVS